MREEKTILELLIILYDRIKDKDRIVHGLCFECDEMFFAGILSEFDSGIEEYVNYHMPKDFESGLYGWEPTLVKPRLRFLQERIRIERGLKHA